MTLASIETQVLEEVGENLTTPEVWDGTGELREALADCLDEICMIGDYFSETIVLALEADVAFYEISANDFYPLFIKRALLREQNRELDCTGLQSIRARDERFLVSRGSPREYVPLAPDLLMIYPCYSTDGGALELEVVGTPGHYSYSEDFLTISEEMEEALIHYGKSYLLMRAGGRMKEAVKEFQNYLQVLPAHELLKHHKKRLSRYMYESITG